MIVPFERTMIDFETTTYSNFQKTSSDEIHREKTSVSENNFLGKRDR